jgi:hypothetical protein
MQIAERLKDGSIVRHEVDKKPASKMHLIGLNEYAPGQFQAVGTLIQGWQGALQDGAYIRTSAVVDINPDALTIETRNTVYHLHLAPGLQAYLQSCKDKMPTRDLENAPGLF